MPHVTFFTLGRHASASARDATGDMACNGGERREHHPSEGDVGHPSPQHQRHIRKYFPPHTIVLQQEERTSAEHRNEEKKNK